MGKLLHIDGMEIDVDEIRSEDMPNEVMREIYDLCGRDVALSLLEYQRGVVLQIPTRPFDKFKKRVICEYFDGTTASIRNICRKFNLADARVREILREQHKKPPSRGQIGLFEGKKQQ